LGAISLRKGYLLLIFICLGFLICSCGNEPQDTTDTFTTTSSPTVSETYTSSVPPEITPPSVSYLPTGMDVEYIFIFPEDASIEAFEIADFSATAHLSSGTEVDITPQTDFSIEEGAGGLWFYNSYVSENAGNWKVTGFFQHPSDGFASWTDSTTLTVTPAN
jgi:hypothetical protein